MKFFIDTAKIDEIKEALKMGLVDGVTTNPSLLYRAGGEPRDVLAEICRLVPGPVSAEVISLEAKGMLAEARELTKIADNIVIKVPIIREGVKAVKMMKAEGIRTNVTLVFSPLQALIAAKAGASFASPFVGRLDDISSYGMDLVRDMVTIYENYGFDTEIIVASIRHPMHVVEAALAGAHIATIPFAVIEKLLAHPLTDIGIKRFLDDWEKLKKK
jgi:transaldolase